MFDVKIRGLVIFFMAGIMVLLSTQQARADLFNFSNLELFFWRNENSFSLQRRLTSRMQVKELTRESRELRRRAEEMASNLKRMVETTLAGRADMSTLKRASDDKVKEARRRSREMAKLQKMQSMLARLQARDTQAQIRRLTQQRKDFIRNLENLRR